jgi:hypothetical protein
VPKPHQIISMDCWIIKLKTKKFHTVRTVSTFNRQIVKIKAKLLPLPNIKHDLSLSWLVQALLLKVAGMS